MKDDGEKSAKNSKGTGKADGDLKYQAADEVNKDYQEDFDGDSRKGGGGRA